MNASPNKRPHEEIGKDYHDDSVTHGSATKVYHGHNDVVQDKIPPLAPISHGSSLFMDVDSASETRLDMKDSTETNIDTFNSKTESKVEMRGDVNKETKHEFKDTMDLDKGIYGSGSKDERYLDTPEKNIALSHGYGPVEVANEGLNAEGKDYLENREAIEDRDKRRKERKLKERVEREKEKNDGLLERKDKYKDKGKVEVKVKECVKKEAVELESCKSVERKENISNIVPQRKRKPRPRSSPRGNEWSEDNNPDATAIIYNEGEYLQHLNQLWEEYTLSSSGASVTTNKGPTQKIRIPSKFVCASNPQVRAAQLWGTDVYTNDSDIVAVLMHTGYFRASAHPPVSAIVELEATIRVQPPLSCYASTLRNSVRSRAWGSPTPCSYRVEKCRILKKGGGTVDLAPVLTPSSVMEFTLAPEVAAQRTITTRASASNVLRQRRATRDVSIQFNLCQEPWLKYSLSVVADEGLERHLFTSSRLKRGEVLYFESHVHRYELCYEKTKAVPATTQEHAMEVDMEVDTFRWSLCKKPLLQKKMLELGTPLPLEHVEILADNVEFDDIEWSSTGVVIAGKTYHLTRAIFLSPV